MYVINIKSKNYTQPTCIIDEHRKTATDPGEIATSFNKYYTSIAGDILKKRKYNGNKNHMDYLQDSLRESFALYRCDPDEIEVRTLCSSII